MAGISANIPFQQATTRLYGELYDAIQRAQSAARTQKGNIILLVAEKHETPDSMLLKTFLFDICERLGINHYGAEQDNQAIADIYGETPKASLFRPDFKRKLDYAKMIDREMRGDSAYFHSLFPLSAHPLVSLPVRERFCAAEMDNNMPKTFGLRPHPLDPLHYERGQAAEALPADDHLGRMKILGSANAEACMAEETLKLAQKVDCICSFGSQHVPYMLGRVQAAGLPVWAMNCSGGDAASDEMAAEIKKSYPSDDFVKKLIANRQVIERLYNPMLPSAPDITLGDKFRMMLVASTKHQLHKCEISYATALGRLNRIAQDMSMKPQEKGGSRA